MCQWPSQVSRFARFLLSFVCMCVCAIRFSRALSPVLFLLAFLNSVTKVGSQVGRFSWCHPFICFQFLLLSCCECSHTPFFFFDLLFHFLPSSLLVLTHFCLHLFTSFAGSQAGRVSGTFPGTSIRDAISVLAPNSSAPHLAIRSQALGYVSWYHSSFCFCCFVLILGFAWNNEQSPDLRDLFFLLFCFDLYQ